MNILFKTLIIIFGLVFFQVVKTSGIDINNSVVFQIIQNQIVFDSSTVESATLSSPKNTADTYGVNIKLKPKAANKFGNLTQENIGKRANIILNGKVVSSTTIQSRLGGEFFVAGLTKKEANQFIKNVRLAK